MKKKVLVEVPRATNSYWEGEGYVVSWPSRDSATVVVMMTSGTMKGESGGFDVHRLNFTGVVSE